MDYALMQAVYYRNLKLSQDEVSFLTCLACAAKDSNSLPSPSLARIADRAGMSVRSASRASKSLNGKGIITISKRKTERGQWCNLYKVNVERLGSQKPIEESEFKSGTVAYMDSVTIIDEPQKAFPSVSKSGTVANNNNITNNKVKNNNKAVEGVIGGDCHALPVVVDSSSSSKTLPSSRQTKTISEEAVFLLVKEGYAEKDAKDRVEAVLEEYNARYASLKKSGALAQKTNPRAYLIGMLVSMAKEGPKNKANAVPRAEESLRTVAEMLPILAEEFARKEEFQKYATQVREFVTPIWLPDEELEQFQQAEADDWKGVTNPFKWVRSIVKGLVTEKVKQLAEEDFKERARVKQVREAEVADWEEILWRHDHGVEMVSEKKYREAEEMVKKLKSLVPKSA